MSEDTYHLLCDALRIQIVMSWCLNLSFIYDNSCKDRPKFVNSKLYRLEGMSRKEALYESKAREVIHRPPGRAGKIGDVRKVLEEFKSQEWMGLLKEFSGTCNILKALRTGKAPPNLIQTLHLPFKSVLHVASIHIHSQIK